MNFQIILTWIQKWWQGLIGILAVLLVFWFGGIIKSCAGSYIKHYNDPVTSSSVTNGTSKSASLTNPGFDVDVLEYTQDWLNLNAPYVLGECYPKRILVKDCVGEQKK